MSYSIQFDSKTDGALLDLQSGALQKNDEEREYSPWISSDEARNYSSFQECSHPSDLRYSY